MPVASVDENTSKNVITGILTASALSMAGCPNKESAEQQGWQQEQEALGPCSLDDDRASGETRGGMLSAAVKIQRFWREASGLHSSSNILRSHVCPELSRASPATSLAPRSCVSTQTTLTDPIADSTAPPISPTFSSDILADSTPPNWTDSHEQFRILLIFANPTNTHPLRLQTEEKVIREALKRGECRQNIHVEVLLACTIDDLARHLMAEGEAGAGYQVIHFSGHADRSASLFRHTMRALHASHDADLASLKSAAVAKQVEAAVEALATSFEASLLSSPSPPLGSFGGGSSSHRQHYSSIHPTTTASSHDSPGRRLGNSNSSALSLSPSRAVKLSRTLSPAPPSHSFSVTSTHHRNRIEKDIHPHTYALHQGGTQIHVKDENVTESTTTSSAASSPCAGGSKRVFTPASAASHLLVREVEVGGPGAEIRDIIDPIRGHRLVPYGSSVQVHQGVREDQSCSPTAHVNIQLEHELHIPKLVVQSRSSPSETIEIEYRQRYSYQDIMDIGVGSLAFESETHDSSSGISFVSPPSLAALLAQHGGPSLQCVLLNVCGGHIQGDLLSSIVPFTVCFTGKVADKESLAFSRGFYDSIAMGQSVLSAFRAGSGRMDLHKLAPGVPDRLTRLTPLLTLLKNQRLLEASLRAADKTRQQRFLQQQEQSADSTSSSAREAALEAQNQRYQQENKELRSLIAYGMELMAGKETELQGLRQALDYVSRAAGLGNTDKKKIGNESKRQLNAVGNTATTVKGGGSSSSSAGAKVSLSPSKKKKYVNVKSSGYGRRNVKSSSNNSNNSLSTTSASKPNFIKRNKAIIILKGNKASETKPGTETSKQGEAPVASGKKQKGYMAATQTSSALSSSVMEKGASQHISVAKKHTHHHQSGHQPSDQKLAVAVAVERVVTGRAALELPFPNKKVTHAPSAPPGPVPPLPPSPPSPLAVSTSILSSEKNSRFAAATASSRTNRVKVTQATETIPTPFSHSKSSPSRIKQPSSYSHSVQKAFPTTIASVKPKSWVKYYISDISRDNGMQNFESNNEDAVVKMSRSVLGGGDQTDEGGKHLLSQSPPPSLRKEKQQQGGQQHTHAEKSRRSMGDSSNASSSLGWRKFLEERRASSSSRKKPSSAFASAVPRFTSAASASHGSSTSPEGPWQWK